MRIARFLVIASVLLTFLLSGNGQPIEKPETTIFNGQITEIDLDQMSMTVEALPLIKIFGIAGDCRVITKTKPSASVEDLRIGDEVDVAYQNVSDTLIAHRIVQKNGTEIEF